MRDYKDLVVWQKANDLNKLAYRVAKSLPEGEKFALTSQLQRSSLSVPANIVEGFYRGKKENSHFLQIAMGSLKETEYYFIVAHDRRYIEDLTYNQAMALADEVSRLIASWQRSLTSSTS